MKITTSSMPCIRRNVESRIYILDAALLTGGTRALSVMEWRSFNEALPPTEQYDFSLDSGCEFSAGMCRRPRTLLFPAIQNILLREDRLQERPATYLPALQMLPRQALMGVLALQIRIGCSRLMPSRRMSYSE